MWDPVPWMVGGGAEHSTNVARNVAYAAFGGNEGVVGGQDLEVRELAVPGTSVRVFPGTLAIKNRATGTRDEMYVGRKISAENVPIAGTNSTASRSDLIIARVENPHMPGEPWNVPPDSRVGPYIFTRVIAGVPAATKSVAELGLGYSAVALARIDLPPSTATVLQAHIKDLRNLSQPRNRREFNMIAPTVEKQLTSTAYVNWPSEGNMTVDIPTWATTAKVRAFLAGVGYGAAGTNGGAGWNVTGYLRIQLGASIYSQGTFYNVSNDGGRSRSTLMAGAPNLPIPATMRGTTQTLRIEGTKNNGSTNLLTDDKSMLSLEIEFVNAPESN